MRSFFYWPTVAYLLDNTDYSPEEAKETALALIHSVLNGNFNNPQKELLRRLRILAKAGDTA